MSYHTIIIVGNLGRDPELRYTPNGTPVANFTVASNRTYTDSNGEQVKETVWFRVSTWGKQAEAVSQYLHKGSRVLVEGRLTPDLNTGGPRIWTRQDGTAAASYEVNASTVRFLGGGNGNGHQQSADEAPVDDLPAADEEIPF